MSLDIYLDNAGPVPRHEAGGTYIAGGTTDPELNITYNYGAVAAAVGIRWRDFHGLRAADTIPTLEAAIAMLGTTDPTEDYWEPTPGNVGHTMALLLKWARQYPEGTWRVSM